MNPNTHTHIVEGDGYVVWYDLSDRECHTHHHQQLAVQGTHAGDQGVTAGKDKTQE